LLKADGYAGADPGFQVRGVHLKKLRWEEGGAEIFGVFHVKNLDFMPKNHIFSNFRGGAHTPGAFRPSCYERFSSKFNHFWIPKNNFHAHLL